MYLVFLSFVFMVPAFFVVRALRFASRVPPREFRRFAVWFCPIVRLLATGKRRTELGAIVAYHQRPPQTGRIPSHRHLAGHLFVTQPLLALYTSRCRFRRPGLRKRLDTSDGLCAHACAALRQDVQPSCIRVPHALTGVDVQHRGPSLLRVLSIPPRRLVGPH